MVGFKRFVVVSLLTSLVLACGSGSSSGSSDNPPVNNNPPPPPAEPELSGLAPASFAFTVDAGQSEAATLNFSNSGEATLNYTLSTSAQFITLPANAQGSVAASGNASLTFQVTCTDSDLNGQLVLTTDDADEETTNIAVNVTCVVPVVDHEISRVLMNQATRAYDSLSDTSPPFGLVSERELLVRAFVTGSGTPPQAQVIISRQGQADQSFAMQVPASISATPASESLLAASHYAVIPAAAVLPGSNLQVELGGGAVFPDSGTVDMNVRDPGTLRVTFVPVTFNGQTPSINAASYFRQTLEQLPIGDHDLEIRSPYTFTSSYDLDTLLDEMTDLRNLDGSTRLYHGIIIPPNGGSQTAGIAYVGFPVGVSIDLNGTQNVISHEIGHNLDLRHAPACSAPNPDASFPDAGGAVTAWGYNLTTNSLVEPTANKTDLMGYCNDVWISGYHFDRALDFRVASPVTSSPQPGLSISGRLSLDGVTNLSMLPVPYMRQADNEAASHRFRGWDASGTLVLDVEFSLHRVADTITPPMFNVVAPAPTAPIHHYQISSMGGASAAVVASGQFAAAEMVELRQAGKSIIWDAAPGQAIIMRNANGEVVSVSRDAAQVNLVEGVASLEVVQNGRSLGVQPLGAERLRFVAE